MLAPVMRQLSLYRCCLSPSLIVGTAKYPPFRFSDLNFNDAYYTGWLPVDFVVVAI
jgi:hypothetical protein